MQGDHQNRRDMDPFTDASPGEEGSAVVSPSRRWSEIWQIPLIVVSVVGILSAIWYRTAEFGATTPQNLLTQARESLQQGDFEGSAAFLVELEPRLLDPDTPQELVAGFHATIGDWHVAKAGNILEATPAQGQAIIESYDMAMAHGWEPQVREVMLRAEAFYATDQFSFASQAVAPLLSGEESDITSRARLVKRLLLKQRIIDGLKAGAEFTRLMVWVDEFMSLDPLPAQEGWITEVHASILLEHNHHGGLVERLVLDMRRLEAIDDGTVDWPALHVMLGKVYRATGRPGPAAERFNFALNTLSADGDSRGDALCFLGEMHLEVGDVSRAEARFRSAMDTPGISDERYEASELGLARTLARRGRHGEASEVFAGAIHRGGFTQGAHVLAIAESLRDEGLAAILAASDKSQTQALDLLEAAIRYGDLAYKAANEPDARRDALRLMGVANDTYARVILEPALGGLDPRDAPLETVPLVMRVKANRHFVAAADSYLSLESIIEPHSEEADGRLIWDAATAMDMGGRPEDAAALYERYLQERSKDDDRRPEALYRLALAAHAALDLEGARLWYRTLISEVDDLDPNTTQSGFATRAKVGLARSLVSGADVGEEALREAEGHLRDIVDGRGAVGPDAPEYREAMFQLGRVLFAMQRWPDTIEVLDAAIKRYAGDPRIPEYAARSGLAWLALAEDAKEQLQATPLSISRRAQIQEACRDALVASVDGFDAAIAGLDIGPEFKLDPLQMQLLRASYLRRADSIAQLGEYASAMEHYREVERRFGEDVTAIEALVRMSNLALDHGDFAAARAATNRATVKLRRLDRTVLDGPALMDGAASDALEKWIALQPPGGSEGGME